MIRYDFTGKVALVTGSSRGIGAAVLGAFAAAGAECVLHYFDDPDGTNRAAAEGHAAELGQQHKARVHLLPADVRDPEAVQNLMSRAAERAGGLDILVNNAGVLRDKSIKKMEIDDWKAVVSTNLDGTFHCCKYAAEVLRDAGRIVNIASISGSVGMHGQANYAASKAGVMGLTRVLAKELSRRQITVNALAPGLVRTSILDDVKPEVLESYVAQIPLRRLAEPADIANAVLFLASEESGYISGQVIPVTGAWF